MHEPDEYLGDVLMHLREPVEGKGPVAAAVVDGDTVEYAVALNEDRDDIVHAERHALETYLEEHGEPGEDAFVVSTLSPCALPDAKRKGCSCVDLLLGENEYDVEITDVYTGYMDPLQLDEEQYEERGLDVRTTDDSDLAASCENLFEYFEDPSAVDDLHGFILEATEPLEGRDG